MAQRRSVTISGPAGRRLFGGRFAPAELSGIVAAADAVASGAMGSVAAPSPPSSPTVATLSGPSSVLAGSAHAARVTLNFVADQAYTVTWSRSDGGTGPATSVIAAGQTSVDANTTWAAPGAARSVDFTISPALTRSGRPLPVNVVDPAAGFTLEARTLGDWTRTVGFNAVFAPGVRYDRFQVMPPILAGASATLSIVSGNPSTGGGVNTLQSALYRLLVDDVEVATAPATPGVSTAATFNFSLSAISHGWHKFDIGGLGPNEVGLWYGFYVDKGLGPAAIDHVPVVTGSFEPEFPVRTTRWTHYAKVPALVAPTTVPLDPRILRYRPPFSAQLQLADLAVYELIPAKKEDRHYPSVDENGILNSYARQDYFWADTSSDRPTLRVLDGPRGVGAPKFLMFLQWSLRPDATMKLYGLTGWGMVSIDETGYTKTLAGWRHKSTPPHWQNPGVNPPYTAAEPQLELVGDWSAVQSAGKPLGFKWPWGFAWDEDTLAVGGPPVGDSPPESPHLTGPVCFVADTLHDRIVKLAFSPVDRSAPPVVTVLVEGLGHPWACIWHKTPSGVRELHISERTAHKISVYNADTGAFIRNVVAATADLAGVSASNFPFVRIDPATGQRYTLAQLRAQPVQSPETITKQGSWAYFGGLMHRCIKRYDLNSGAVEMYCDFAAMGATDDNSFYLQFAIGDGSFGPAGTIFLSTWSVAPLDVPKALVPGASPTSFTNWNWTGGAQQAGQPLPSTGYQMAAAVAKGVMAYTGAEEAVVTVMRRLPGDPSFNGVYFGSYGAGLEGQRDYIEGGYHLVFGTGGYGYYGLPVPWGLSANIDVYLRSRLHRRIPAWRKSRPLLEWFAIAGTAAGLGDSRMAFSGAALQTGLNFNDAVWWNGPGGGHNNNSVNDYWSCNLALDSPSGFASRYAATPLAQRTQDTHFYADGRPPASHLYSGMWYSWRHNRILRLGAYATFGSGGFNSSRVHALNPDNGVMDPANTFPDAGVRYGCEDHDGNIWSLNFSAAGTFGARLLKWDVVTRTNSQVGPDNPTIAGAPLAFDRRRHELFSLSIGNGEDLQVTSAIAFKYHYETGARTPITLNSIGGALESFVADQGQYAGMVYVDELDEYLYYDGRADGGRDRRGRIYGIKPNATTTWDMRILSTTGPVPPATRGSGILSRFAYHRGYKCLLLQPDGTQPIWCLPITNVS